jgi:hypothetical protein
MIRTSAKTIRRTSMSESKRFSHTTEAVLIVLILAAALALLHLTEATGVPLKSFEESDVIAIVTSLFVVAVFMERSIEAILTPVRAPDRQKIEQELEDIKNAAETDDSKKGDQIKKERELETYRLNTARRAYWLSFGFGLIISVVGIRTLEGLVNPEDFEALGDLHKTLFSFVDIVLTGGVIAGGSAAIDKIGRAISEFFSLKSATDEKPPANPGGQ